MKNAENKKTERPFALEFLEPLPESEMLDINGGRRHGKKPPYGPLTGIGTHPTAGNPHWDFEQ